MHTMTHHSINHLIFYLWIGLLFQWLSVLLTVAIEFCRYYALTVSVRNRIECSNTMKMFSCVPTNEIYVWLRWRYGDDWLNSRTHADEEVINNIHSQHTHRNKIGLSIMHAQSNTIYGAEVCLAYCLYVVYTVCCAPMMGKQKRLQNGPYK